MSGWGFWEGIGRGYGVVPAIGVGLVTPSQLPLWKRVGIAFSAPFVQAYGGASGFRGYAGTTLGLGLGVGGSVLAGAALYSGLANLWRGDYGRATGRLLAGTALVTSLYMGWNMWNDPTNDPRLQPKLTDPAG